MTPQFFDTVSAHQATSAHNQGAVIIIWDPCCCVILVKATAPGQAMGVSRYQASNVENRWLMALLNIHIGIFRINPTRSYPPGTSERALTANGL